MKLRRKEYKRKRWYKRRAARRHPLSRILKDFYINIRDNWTIATLVATPLCGVARIPGQREVRWGGDGMYFDIAVEGSPLGDAQTTRATFPGAPRNAVPVNYNAKPKGPFYRDPFRSNS